MSVPISDANVIYRQLAPDVEFQLTLGWGLSPKVKQIVRLVNLKLAPHEHNLGQPRF